MSRTSIAFTGDIGFDKYMHGQWADPALLSDDVQGYLQAAGEFFHGAKITT